MRPLEVPTEVVVPLEAIDALRAVILHVEVNLFLMSITVARNLETPTTTIDAADIGA